jgi:hypothetical protein
MLPRYEWQCLCCGAVHTADHPPAAGEQRECIDCALHGRPRYPRYRWRPVDPGTPAEQLTALRTAKALGRKLRETYGPVPHA